MLHVEENEHDYKIRNYFNLSPIKTKRRLYTDFYDIGDELGRGTQGITYHAVERLNGNIIFAAAINTLVLVKLLICYVHLLLTELTTI